MGSSVVMVNRRMQETVLYVEDDLNLTILCTKVESKEVPEVFFKHLFIYLGCARSSLQRTASLIFAVAWGTFSCSIKTLNCGMWDLVP